MKRKELKAIIKEIVSQCIQEINPEKTRGGKSIIAVGAPGSAKRNMAIADPTREEMLQFLQSQFGSEEGWQDEAEVAMYWFANFNHGGQNSNLYSVLSTSPFSPGPIARGPQPESMEEDMYKALESEYGGREHMHNDEDMLEMTTTGAVQGYMTPRAFKKKKYNESEIVDPTTGEVAPGPRDRFEMHQGGSVPQPDAAKIKKALQTIGQMKHHEWRALMDRAIRAHRFLPDDGSDPERLNLGLALQYLAEHP